MRALEQVQKRDGGAWEEHIATCRASRKFSSALFYPNIDCFVQCSLFYGNFLPENALHALYMKRSTSAASKGFGDVTGSHKVAVTVKF